MALKYNEKTGEFEPVSPYTRNTSPAPNSSKPKMGCIGSLFLSFMYGLGAWTIGFFVLVIFFPDASDDTTTVLIVINFILSAVVAFKTFMRNQQ